MYEVNANGGKSYSSSSAYAIVEVAGRIECREVAVTTARETAQALKRAASWAAAAAGRPAALTRPGHALPPGPVPDLETTMSTDAALAADPLPGLLAAIDAREDDDTALLGILADLLEDRGDPRAAGLRRLTGKAPNDGYCWYVVRPRSYFGRNPCRHQVVSKTLPQGWTQRHPTRSAAYLAMAEALITP